MQRYRLRRLRLNRAAPFPQIMMRQYQMLQRKHLFGFQINVRADRRFRNPVRGHRNMSDKLALYTVIRDNPKLGDHFLRFGNIM
ncbi:hypothetical protein D3C85_1463680 [compost metagenome]